MLPAQDMYSTIDDAVKLVVANKVDRGTEREVTFEQGAAFAKRVSPDVNMLAVSCSSSETTADHCVDVGKSQNV